MNEYQRNYARRMRQLVIDTMGGKCVKCGLSDSRVLQVDHINGGGQQEKKIMTKNQDKYFLESFLKNENKLQLLCANCNWIKRHENDETNRGWKWTFKQ